MNRREAINEVGTVCGELADCGNMQFDDIPEVRQCMVEFADRLERCWLVLRDEDWKASVPSRKEMMAAFVEGGESA
jgi:hypothetical protein